MNFAAELELFWRCYPRETTTEGRMVASVFATRYTFTFLYFEAFASIFPHSPPCCFKSTLDGGTLVQSVERTVSAAYLGHRSFFVPLAGRNERTTLARPLSHLEPPARKNTHNFFPAC